MVVQVRKMPVEVWIGLAVALAILLAFMMPNRSVDRTADEVAQIIRNFIDGKGDRWVWDDFESFPITDPELERIRQEALLAAPPNPNLVKLADLAIQAEALAKTK